jgi:hypothetical protein
VLYDNKLQPTGVSQITVSNALVDDNIFSKELGDLGADSFLGVVNTVNSSGTHTVQFD